MNDQFAFGRHRQRAERTGGSAILGWSLSLLVGLSAVYTAVAAPGQIRPPKRAPATVPPAKNASTIAGLTAADAKTLEATFTRELWPTLTERCAPCHGARNASQFLLPADPHAAFLKMLAEGHFDEDNHASAVARMTTTDKTVLMPPPASGALLQAKIAPFESFAESVRSRQKASGYRADEAFPAHLLLPYTGAPHPGLDNTFLTFRQLRGKVASVFGDDWKRGDRDLFLENVHLFGGADFVKRFDETSKPAPTFLTGVEMMARDVASKAYLNRTGPFAGFPATMPSPLAMKAPNTAYTAAIVSLYRRMLFRDPTPSETRAAFRFLAGVYKNESSLTRTAPQDVRFSLTVADETGLSVTREIAITVRPDRHALTAAYVDQSGPGDSPEPTGETAHKDLGAFTLKPDDPGQRVIVSNAATYGNVSVASVSIIGPGYSKTIAVDDPSVSVEGAWKMRTDNKVASADDNNENKGASTITFPLPVPSAGKYAVAFAWRRVKTGAPRPGGGNRRNLAPTAASRDLCVQVISSDASGIVATPPAAARPPRGEAHFFVDETIDNIPWIDLKTAFRFGPGDGVSVRNDNTARRVVADAIRLEPASTTPGASAAPILLLGKDAIGRESWARFPKESFNPYNTVGPELLQDLADGQSQKSQLSLLYKPASAIADGFSGASFYKVGVIFPGKVDNETRVPIIVTAQASSPIVQIAAPLAAHIGSKVTVDASGTYNIQQSKLSFRWTQIGGPRVAIANPTSPTITLTAPPLSAQQAAWEGLCRALIAHPDFLFTRPRSLASVSDPAQRRRLQVVKLAQDLVGRTPSAAELAKVDSGAPVSSLVDSYLASPEFADFYFHRVRLYLESHGTIEQDEPARLWTYIATHDRSFQEILTADYTVDTSFRKASRPSYHGRTGVLTMKGFLTGKPSLPHFNYSAQVCEKFLGYIFEVPDEIVQSRQGITASATTDPNSVCYTCHKVLTPLAYQRAHWDDDGNFRVHDDTGLRLDATDQGMVANYPFKGDGIEAFALQAAGKERFIRTMLQTHFVWYFGRDLRHETDERNLYGRLWDTAAAKNYAIRPIIRAMVLSPEYLNGAAQTPAPPKPDNKARMAKLAQLHSRVQPR